MTPLQRQILRVLHGANLAGEVGATTDELTAVLKDLGLKVERGSVIGCMGSLTGRARCFVASLREYTGRYVRTPNGFSVPHYVNHWTITLPGMRAVS